MEDDEEDVKRMIQVINDQKSNLQTTDHIEFEDFINFFPANADFSDDEAEQIPNDDEEVVDVKCHQNDTELSLLLKEEEKQLIDQCPDPELKKLLILNRRKNILLMQFHLKIKDAILKNKSKISQKKHEVWRMETKVSESQPANTWKLAAPYFKDLTYYCAPQNQDVARKRANGELSIYDMTLSKRWVDSECNRLKHAVICVYNIERQRSTSKKIIALKSRHDSDDKDDTIGEKINELKGELESLKRGKDKCPPLGSDDFIDWSQVSQIHFKSRRSVQECRAMWHVYLHPNISKKKWSESENSKLKVIVQANNMQNWELIAKELGTNRSAFTACLHFVRNLNDKFKKTKFTPEEDKLLSELVELNKHGDRIIWSQISHHFEQRTRVQLYHRYVYYLTQSHVTKGKFSEAEDILLMILVDKFGKQFKKCAEYMPHRSQIQLKSRYSSNLCRTIKKGSFSRDEDRQIVEHVERNGQKAWGELAKRLQRSRGQFRQRYHTIKRYLDSHPSSTLNDVPQRRHDLLSDSDKHYEFLKFMANEYGKGEIIPTLTMIEECIGIKKDQVELASTSLNLDEIIINTITKSLNKTKTTKRFTFQHISEACDNAAFLLSILDAKLEIPEYLGGIPQLDSTDKAILEQLRTKTKPDDTKINLVPPQLGTALGLRGLLVMDSRYEKSPSHQPIVRNCDLNRFSKRFNSIFHWSSVLSLDEPLNTDEPPPKKPKIVPLRNLLGNSLNKISFSVDKCVVDALIKKNIDVKILQVNPPQKRIVQKCLEATSNNDNDDSDDYEDVHKLDLILRTKPCDEYETLETIA